MKKVLLLMTIVLLAQIRINAQTNSYIPFPKEAVWQIWKTKSSSSGNTVTTPTLKTMKGDTIINGLKYVKYFDPILTSAIRDDSTGKKVFCYDFTSNKETLLYDFNLSVGDTVFILTMFNKNFKYWVTEIDSVLLLDHNYHNRYLFNKHPPNGMRPVPELSPLIEGLGYYSGNKFTYTNEGNSDEQISYATICASANKKLLIAIFGVPPNGDYCGATITDIQPTMNKNEFTLYPNPTNDKFQLRAEIPDAYTIELINVLGKRILSAELKNSTIEIDLSGQPAGIYFVTLLTKEGNSFSRKIIKN